jgi:hypothetical protein
MICLVESKIHKSFEYPVNNEAQTKISDNLPHAPVKLSDNLPHAPVELSDNLPHAPMKLSDNFTGNFQPIAFRTDKGMIWETMYYKLLCEKYETDDILFWRTTDGNEVDFVMPYITNPYAVEIKYDKALIKPAKYQKFETTYPDIPLSFGWLQPFDESFF